MDEPTVLLLHGLGATGSVWRGMTELLDQRCIAPDLPGHGRSEPLPRYTFGHLAAAVADLVADAGSVVVVGHSLGGVVALALASGWFGVKVDAVVALGVKVEWSEDELAKAAAMAARPAKTFATRDEAVQRHLKVAGLTGLPNVEVDSGLVEVEGGWQLALDQAAFGVGAPDMPGLLAAARCPVVLAAGEHDPMSRPEQLRALDPDTVILPGLGHNAHVEDPKAGVSCLTTGVVKSDRRNR
jgi:pimeloyl-ACP methyl ester carboxylesterase